jgi:hypothetical protein
MERMKESRFTGKRSRCDKQKEMRKHTQATSKETQMLDDLLIRSFPFA